MHRAVPLPKRHVPDGRLETTRPVVGKPEGHPRPRRAQVVLGRVLPFGGHLHERFGKSQRPTMRRLPENVCL